jgi:acyl-ACP thioesterase
MQSELSRPWTIRISDCDAEGRLRPSALLVEMQELGEAHAAMLGLARQDLIAHGICWVLYRQQVRLLAPLTFGDALTALTFPAPVEGPLFPRHFVFSRADGTPAIEAVTAWVLMDVRTRRPLRPSALPVPMPENRERPAPLKVPGMLPIEGAQTAMRRAVRYSDVDVNRHINNTRYIDWVCDALPYEAVTARAIAGFQINYSSEARPGEDIDIALKEEEKGVLARGIRLSDGRTVFDSRIEWA